MVPGPGTGAGKHILELVSGMQAVNLCRKTTLKRFTKSYTHRCSHDVQSIPTKHLSVQIQQKNTKEKV